MEVQDHLQEMNKLEERNLNFTVFAGYHSFMTLGKQFVCFLHLAGVDNRGGCAVSQHDLRFIQNPHEAHGLHVYWQAQEMYKRRKLTLKKLSLALPC